MSIITLIKEDQFYLGEDTSLVCTDNQQTSVIELSNYPEISLTIKLNKQIIRDACFLTHSQFVAEYKANLLSGAPLCASDLYRNIRHIIVDEELPIPKKKKGVSRFDQVKSLYESGITSPSQIAKQIGSHTSYVSQILKKIR